MERRGSPLPPAANHLFPAARFRYISFCDLCLPRSASCQSVLPALSACSASPNLDQLSKSSTHHPFNKTTLNCPKPSLPRFWKKSNTTVFALEHYSTNKFHYYPQIHRFNAEPYLPFLKQQKCWCQKASSWEAVFSEAEMCQIKPSKSRG